MSKTGEKGTVLILGATGQQGGATARQLLRQGWPVRALVRRADSPAARALARAGAELAIGDMEDAASIEAAMRGVHGVFSVQPPSWAPDAESDAKEVWLGRLAVDVAVRSGVRHLVYTSVLGADRQRHFGRTHHKLEIEQHVWSSGLPATVLRPAGFMENLLLQAADLSAGFLPEPTNADVAVALIAVDDIGAFAALAFEQPARFAGQTLELAGDRLTPPQMAAALSRVLNRSITHRHVPAAALQAGNATIAALYRWLNEHGYPPVDTDALRTLRPGLQRFEPWLLNGGGLRLRTLLETPA